MKENIEKEAERAAESLIGSASGTSATAEAPSLEDDDAVSRSAAQHRRAAQRTRLPGRPVAQFVFHKAVPPGASPSSAHTNFAFQL